jgi:sugar phosphate isomerase/epimerase
MTIDENIWKSHHPYMARPGQGIVDWQGMARLMREIKYEGWAVLELDAGPNPPMQIREAREFMERSVLHAYSEGPIRRME